MAIKAKTAYQLASLLGSQAKGYSYFNPVQHEQATSLTDSAQGALQNELAKEAAKKAKKKDNGLLSTATQVAGLVAAPFTAGASIPISQAAASYMNSGSPTTALSSGLSSAGGMAAGGYWGGGQMAAPSTQDVTPAPAPAPAMPDAGYATGQQVQVAEFPPMTMGQPASMPAASALDNNTAAMMAPPIAASPTTGNPNLTGALLGGAAGLGLGMVSQKAQEQKQYDSMPAGGQVAQDFGILQAGHTGPQANIYNQNEVKSDPVIAQKYAEDLARVNAKIPVAVWRKLPREIRAAIRNNDQSSGAAPSYWNQLSQYAPAMFGAGAGAAAGASLQPNQDGTYTLF